MSACILSDNSSFKLDTGWTPACVHSTDPLLGAQGEPGQVSGKEVKGELRCPVISPVATRGHDHSFLSSSAQGRQRMHCGLSQTEMAALVERRGEGAF